MLSQEQIDRLREKIGSDDELPYIFHALSDAGRWRIFLLLADNDDLCVTDIANILNTSVPAASQQLKVMEMTGLVIRERDGQMICYKMKRENPLVRTVLKMVRSFEFARSKS